MASLDKSGSGSGEFDVNAFLQGKTGTICKTLVRGLRKSQLIQLADHLEISYDQKTNKDIIIGLVVSQLKNEKLITGTEKAREEKKEKEFAALKVIDMRESYWSRAQQPLVIDMRGSYWDRANQTLVENQRRVEEAELEGMTSETLVNFETETKPNDEIKTETKPNDEIKTETKPNYETKTETQPETQVETQMKLRSETDLEIGMLWPVDSLAEARLEVSALQTSVKVLQTAKTTFESQFIQAEVALKEEKLKNASVKKELELSNEVRQSLVQKLDEFEDTVSVLNGEKRILEEQKQTLINNFANFLESDLAEVKDELKTEQVARQSLTEEVKRLQSNVVEKEENLNSLQKQIQDASEREKLCKATIGRLEDTVKKVSVLLTEKETAFGQLEVRFKDKESECEIPAIQLARISIKDNHESPPMFETTVEEDTETEVNNNDEMKFSRKVSTKASAQNKQKVKQKVLTKVQRKAWTKVKTKVQEFVKRNVPKQVKTKIQKKVKKQVENTIENLSRTRREVDTNSHFTSGQEEPEYCKGTLFPFDPGGNFFLNSCQIRT